MARRSVVEREPADSVLAKLSDYLFGNYFHVGRATATFLNDIDIYIYISLFDLYEATGVLSVYAIKRRDLNITIRPRQMTTRCLGSASQAKQSRKDTSLTSSIMQ